MPPGGRGARFVHTALAIALAVGLVSGTFVLTDTIDAGFHQATAASRSSVDVVVRATSSFSAEASALPERNPVPADLLSSVQSVSGVRSAWGSIWGWAQVVDPAGKAVPPNGLPTLGAAWGPDQGIVAGRAPQAAGETALDEATARAHGFRLGDQVKVLFGGGSGEFVLTGLLKPGAAVASTLVAFDLGTAQRVLQRPGAFDAISVRAGAGVTPEALRTRLQSVLPHQFEAVTATQAANEAATSWSTSLRFLTTALLVFAGISLLVGALIIFNTFSIVVGQRTRELGLLRAVGASRGQIVRGVLRDAFRVGMAASLGGIVLGFGIAFGLLQLMRGIGYSYPVAGVVFLPRTALVALGAGLSVTMLAAILPARRATRVSPIATLGGAVGGDEAGALRSRLVAVATRVLAFPLVRVFGRPALLGRENAVRNPRRTSATATALMIGIGLVGVVAIVAASMKASAERTVSETLRADFVVTTRAGAGTSGGVPPVVAERLRAAPGVGVVSEIRTGEWGLDGKATSLVAVDPATVTGMHELDPASKAAALRLDDGGVLVRDTTAAARGWRVGDTVPMTFARTGTKALRLAGVYSTTTVHADYVISLGAFEANFAQQLDAEIDVGMASGLSPAAARASVRRVLTEFPSAEVMNRDEVVAAQDAQINRILVPVSALLALSLLIALLGIANTLALSIHERTRELGMLRAIGMARGQLRSMIRSEAMIIAALGSVLGVAVAVGLGWLPVASMREAGVTELVFPVRQLAGLVVVASLAGLVAGIVPARRAARLPVLDAVAGD
ncbi:MAG: FtsX-like permease family protein [Actinomycetota bacterium]|nr:FtsX-like permease family protein [Actinomycetota bacterium]